MAEPGLTISRLQQLVHDFNASRGWLQKHSTRSLSEALVVEASELLQLSLWDAEAERERLSLSAEIADVAIYLVSLANHLDLDLASVIAAKMSENEGRFPRIDAAP